MITGGTGSPREGTKHTLLDVQVEATGAPHGAEAGAAEQRDAATESAQRARVAQASAPVPHQSHPPDPRLHAGCQDCGRIQGWH